MAVFDSSLIWLNELRSRRVRAGGGFVDATEALVVDGGREIETNIFVAQVLKEVGGLPEAQREAVLLVYVEGFTYREAAEIYHGADRHRDQPARRGEIDVGKAVGGSRPRAASPPGRKWVEVGQSSGFKMSTIDEDARLVAFIDGELDEGARAELEARLAIDPVLHERLARLQEGGRPFAERSTPYSMTRPSSAWKPCLRRIFSGKTGDQRRFALL